MIPIAQLKNEKGELVDLFSGDHYWYASAQLKRPVKNSVDVYLGNSHYWNERQRRFATEKAAQNFLDAEAIEGLTVYQVMPVLIRALREDPGYRIGWQANIAMAFKDEFDKVLPTYGKVNSGKIIAIANQAADNFLNLLIK